VIDSNSFYDGWKHDLLDNGDIFEIKDNSKKIFLKTPNGKVEYTSNGNSEKIINTTLKIIVLQGY